MAMTLGDLTTYREPEGLVEDMHKADEEIAVEVRPAQQSISLPATALREDSRSEHVTGRPRPGIVNPKNPNWIPRDIGWEIIRPETQAKLIEDGQRVRRPDGPR
ncbi:hypothetical protein [Amycolatopsis sp. NPDC059657]|uniref:hypothetical protein n=1 Tax=Amycolatopsis sp. NPDC059657 TaxID=3346899 RepID=UPI0036732C19